MKQLRLIDFRQVVAGIFFLTLTIGLSTPMMAQTSKEYADTEAATFATDLTAGTYDVYVLSTSGGIYNINYPVISANATVQAKEGLAAKPILKNTANTSSSKGIINVTGGTVVFQDIEFDGSGAGTAPLIIRSDNEVQLQFKNCYIHDGTAGGGVIQMRGAGTSVDMQNTLVANCVNRVLCAYTTGVVYGDISVKNSTFANISGGGIVFYRSASSVFAAGNNVTVDHSTFYNIASDVIRVQADSIHGTITVTNSIFDQIPDTLTADVIDYNYLAGLTKPPLGTNTIATVPVYTDAANLDFTLTNADQLLGSDGKTLGDLSGYPEVVLPQNEFTVDQIPEFLAALEAGTFDTLFLATSGGLYDINYPTIPGTVVIMGKAGLEAKPILKNTANTSSSNAIVRINGSAVLDTIVFRNIEFDGSGAATDPMIIRADNSTHIVIKDCYIHDVLQGGGVIQLRGEGSSLDMQNTMFVNCNRRVINAFTEGILYGDMNITNCTFSGITGGDVVYFRSASSVFAAGNDININHCTFHNITGNITRYQADSIHGTVSVTNSIFNQVTGGLDADVIDYNYLAGLGTPPAGTNSITTAPVFADATNGNFTLTNKDDLIGGDFQFLGDLSWYDDVYPPRVLELLAYIDNTHLMVSFNEIVDFSTVSSTLNYTLSGTAGLTGNPSKAEQQQNGTDVILTVGDMSAMVPNQNVIVTVTNVEDLNGNVITDNNVATYTLLDNTAPVITMAEQSVSNDPGQEVLAQSNELGKIYLVLNGVPQSTIEELDAAVGSGNGAVADVVTINTDVSISTEGFKVGMYYAYAVDAYSNISDTSTNAVTVTDVTMPVLTMEAQEVSNTTLGAVLAQSTETGMIYLILDGETQSTVADFEAAVVAMKGAVGMVYTANSDVSISPAGIDPGMYYGYAVDNSGNISAKSTNAITVTEYIPRVRYYEETEAETLVEDMKTALDGDVFILTTDGGHYNYIGQADISAKITIMGDENLAVYPVLNTIRENNTKQVFRLIAEGASITAKRIDFNSGSLAPGSWPTKYAFRNNPGIGNFSIIMEDCYFRGTWRSNDDAGGDVTNGSVINLREDTHGENIIFKNCLFDGDEGLRIVNAPFSWDNFEITNCTFMNIPEEEAIRITQTGDNKNLPVKINHCTFSKVGGIDAPVIVTDSMTMVTLTNSIFATSTADTTWLIWGEGANKTSVDYVNFFDFLEPNTGAGGVLGANKWNHDPQFADQANGDLTLGNSVLYNLGSDGLPLGDLRWADIFGPEVSSKMTARSDSTLLLSFNEWIDTTTASVANNYILSGSAGYTGAVKKVELFNFHSVLITLESFAAQVGNEIIVTVANVEDLKGNVVNPDFNIASYTVEEFRPVVTANAQTATNGADQFVVASSNLGTGMVYIILDGEVQSNKAELDAAVAAMKGASAEVTEAYIDIEISVSGIEPGIYYAYVTDANGVLSEIGTNAITITDGIPPVIKVNVQSAENGPANFILAQSNELGKIYIVMDGEPQETVDDLISATYVFKGKSQDVLAENTDVQVSTNKLVPGIYYAYAVDKVGNKSLKGSSPLNITKATGIEDNLKDKFNLYSHNRSIVIETDDSENVHLAIINILGKVVVNEQLNKEKTVFNMDQGGIYIVKLYSGNEILKTKKLIVK